MTAFPLSAPDLRRAFGQFATGVCVIGTQDDTGRRHGATVNSFTSVSLEPALLLVCLGHFMRSHDAFAGAKSFGVSVLGAAQQEAASHFAGKSDDKWASFPPLLGESGGLLLPDALARFDCTTEAVVPQGDHTLLIGRIHGVQLTDGAPLLYHGGKFALKAA